MENKTEIVMDGLKKIVIGKKGQVCKE